MGARGEPNTNRVLKGEWKVKSLGRKEDGEKTPPRKSED